MKALIISDDSIAIERFSAVLKDFGYDIIVYHWLVKALDNIEEIAPHLILVSTLEYPRHWKTLKSYTESGITDIPPQIILFTGDNFSEEEKEKAEALKIRGWFSTYDVDGLDKLRKILMKTDDIFEGTLDKTLPNSSKINFSEDILHVDNLNSDDKNIVGSNMSLTNSSQVNANDKIQYDSQEIITDEISVKNDSDFNNLADIDFVFTNPKDKTFVSGQVLGFDGNEINFLPDYKIEKIQLKTIIDNAILKCSGDIKFIKAQILSKTDGVLTIKVLKEVI